MVQNFTVCLKLKLHMQYLINIPMKDPGCRGRAGRKMGEKEEGERRQKWRKRGRKEEGRRKEGRKGGGRREIPPVPPPAPPPHPPRNATCKVSNLSETQKNDYKFIGYQMKLYKNASPLKCHQNHIAPHHTQCFFSFLFCKIKKKGNILCKHQMKYKQN